mmetsp:Transcript_20464/g.51872  ORF Transcript_20464/g.51872 Transcript_20464/m.51872 type:complete len:269 (+) Transcript_20464:76-882(+)
MRDAMDGDVAAERQLNFVERLLVRMPRNRGFRVHADGSVSVYPVPSRARFPAAKQKSSSPRLSQREPRSGEAGSKRAANARTRRSAKRAAERAARRGQAELRLQQLACKMAKVLRWKRRQEVWTAWMRDETASAPATSLAQPAAPAPAPAAPPPPAPSSPDVRMRSPSSSVEKRMHTPDSRPSQTPATPPSAPKMKRRKPGAVAAALAAAATPQAHTATSEAAPDPTPPPPPPTSPPSASWPALPTRTGHGPETNIPAWGRECRPPQG